MDSATKLNRKKRIMTDLQRLREPPEPHLPKYDIRQDRANDLNVIYTEIRGPKDSFYEGGYFVLRFEFTNDYPVSSPSVAFITKVWHPNVDHNSGSVCLNSLNQNWQPTVNLRHILDTHMPWLLKNGNPDDPLNTEAGQQMKSKDPKYGSMVRQWVKRHAHQSRLKEYGSVWYKDQPTKKKKKKKFNLAELTQSTPSSTDNHNHNHNHNPNAHAHGQPHSHTQTVTPSMSAQSTPHFMACTPPSTKALQEPSKSMGHIEYAKGHGGCGGAGAVGVCDFQDWWRGSRHLPNTPSKSGQPQIRRTQSFQNRADSSPWLSKRPMRRAASDALIGDGGGAGDGDGEYYEDDMQMQLFSLQNYVEDDGGADLDSGGRASQAARSHRMLSAQDDDGGTKRDKSRKKTRGSRMPKQGTGNRSYDTFMVATENNSSELSSMDEDPTYDLEQYQSLTSLDIASLPHVHEDDRHYGHAHSSSDSHKNNNNRDKQQQQQQQQHRYQSSSSSYHSYGTPQQHQHRHVVGLGGTGLSYTASSLNYSYSSSVSLRSLSSRPPYYDSVLSRSAGFMPQNIDHCICPEFSPLSPDKPMLPASAHASHERILHFSPTVTAQSKSNSIKTALFLNDSHAHEEDDNGDIDIEGGMDRTSSQHTKIDVAAVLKNPTKLKTTTAMVKHDDVEMADNNRNRNSNGCNVLIHDASNRMSMD